MRHKNVCLIKIILLTRSPAPEAVFTKRSYTNFRKLTLTFKPLYLKKQNIEIIFFGTRYYLKHPGLLIFMFYTLRNGLLTESRQKASEFI